MKVLDTLDLQGNAIINAGADVVADGNKGDVTVSGGGTVWTIDADAVTYAKMQNVSATDKLLGRATAGAGNVEEIALTAAGRALIDDADAAAQRATLSAAPANATYIMQTANSETSAEQALSALASGYLKNTTGTGVLSVQAAPIPVADGGTGVAAIPAFAVNKGGTGQTGIVTATHTLVTWSTESVDSNNNFASNKFTPTVAGTYLVVLVVYWDSMADQAFMIPEIYKNGSLIAGTAARASGTSDQGNSTVVVVSMNGSTDYLEAYAYQSTGSNKNINGNATATYFAGAWIGP